ncbi:hypothetical protein PROFUN_11891 [Planoprotostelium fungivorum]|uniref:PPM-type phosphatase domain-containing protein n=1 Tax=Planoprotostelium fungivorum TaxID=1890364 RepID=A0A2P6N904_9EUKA|nr:hypothetical protein PROFUN_11891 [Planoprotostelium fungivorum]
MTQTAKIVDATTGRTVNVQYAVSMRQGQRPYQEDAYEVFRDDAEHRFLLYGIFDGHGGSKFSRHAKEHIFDIILKEGGHFARGEYKEALRAAFKKEDSLMHGIDNPAERGGTTATVAIITPTDLYVANVGDSRAIVGLVTGDSVKALRVTKDHNLADPKEKQRVIEAGATVRADRVIEEGHGLNMTRALGDFEFKTDCVKKDVVLAEPHLKHIPLDEKLRFIVLASDGLWDVTTDQELADVIQLNIKGGFAPDEVVNENTAVVAKKFGSDNITMILAVLDLQQ